MSPVAVASRSFSKHSVLRSELAARFPNAKFNDAGASLKGEELVAFLSGCEKAVLALETVDDALLVRLPELRLVSKFGVGLDSFDLKAMAARGVKLAWSPGTNSRSVAELALMSMIALLRRVPEACGDLAAGKWGQPKGSTLTGKTVGLVGLGAVGRELAALLAPFGVSLLAHEPAPDQAAVARHAIRLVPLDELLAQSDAVSLHIPLTPSTRNTIDSARLARMKPSAVLINTARGGLIDEDALLEALDSGRLAGAALDAFAVEPLKDRRLAVHPRILATPHIGGSTEEAILAMGRAAIAGLDAGRDAAEFIRG
ncbi:MAG: phosphoglycerate dehydrogenase [Elusimicrobiota bacterium]|nr:phosphoglycerate dehydrogenase [Elusimicrobiota bacterium]